MCTTLRAARHQVPTPSLARCLLALGIAATLTANIAQGWPGIPACKPSPRNVSADGQDATVATITEAEKILGIPRITLYRWLREGFITGEQIVPAAPWHIRIDQALRDKIQSQAPDGWLPVDQAAKALGLSRTTVFQKVRDGQLPAIHVNNGQRRSLRIQVKPEAAGLFDTPK